MKRAYFEIKENDRLADRTYEMKLTCPDNSHGVTRPCLLYTSGDVGRGKYITDVLRFRLSLFSVRGLDEELALIYGDIFVYAVEKGSLPGSVPPQQSVYLSLPELEIYAPEDFFFIEGPFQALYR